MAWALTLAHPYSVVLSQQMLSLRILNQGRSKVQEDGLPDSGFAHAPVQWPVKGVLEAQGGEHARAAGLKCIQVDTPPDSRLAW